MREKGRAIETGGTLIPQPRDSPCTPLESSLPRLPQMAEAHTGERVPGVELE